MSSKENKETDSLQKKEKKPGKKIQVSLPVVILYSAALIAVMVLSYAGVKAVFFNYDRKIAEASQQEPETEEEVIKEEPETTPEPSKTPVPEPEEDRQIDHDMPADELTDPETGMVDYSVVKFTPGKRNKDLKWKDSVFSRIENVKEPEKAAVNKFDYRRVSVRLTDNETSEYKIYTNPESRAVEKITEIRNCGESLEVVDYYYDNGNINYVAEHKTYVDKPIDISSKEIESRYYFRNDTLIRYIFCKDQEATEYSVAAIDDYSKGTVDQYDYLEKDMINRAYIVYNVAPSIKETKTLSGYVLDEFSMPMENAKIVVKSEKDDRVVAESVTDGDGMYKIAIDCSDDETFCIMVSKETLNDVGVYGITAKPGSGKYAVEPVYLGYTNNVTTYPAQFVVRDAADPNKPLSGAGVMIRRGLNNRTGEVMQTGQLDDNGNASIALTSGSYTAEISKGGYETLFLSVIIRLDHQFAIGFAVPDVGDNTYRAVVSWESAPLDLNAKAISSDQARVISSPVDSLGLTTAECVTIDNADDDDYRFYITDFGSITSGDMMSYNMTESNAYVDVYNSEGLCGKFHVPAASAGVVWEVFEIHDKSLLPVNSYYYAVEDDALWKSK